MKETPSPCIRNCCLDEENICLGCFRHINEIMQWSNSTELQKQQIIRLTITRKKQAIRSKTNNTNK